MTRHRSQRLAAVAFLLVAGTASAARAVNLSVTDSAGMPGSHVTVSLVLDNDVAVRGVQLVLRDAPDRLQLAGARRTMRSQALDLEFEERTDGSVPLVLISLGDATIAAGNAAIVDFDLIVGTDTTPGETITVTLDDVRVADAAGLPLAATTGDGTVLVEGGPGTATATPSTTGSETPSPTSTSEPTATPPPAATSSPTQTVEATATPTPSGTATPTATATFTCTSTPVPTASATSTFTPTPTATASETPTSSPTTTDTATRTPLATPTPTATASCPGDCDGDASVAVDELLVLVNISLGSAPVSACTSADVEPDGAITVDEILVAVNRALNGC